MRYPLLERRHLNLLFFAHLHDDFFQANRFSTVRLSPEFDPVLLFVKLFDHIIYLLLVFFGFLHFFSLRAMVVLVECLRQGASYVENQKVNVPLKDNFLKNTKSL